MKSIYRIRSQTNIQSLFELINTAALENIVP